MNRSLFRHFAYRFVDNDLIAAGGETHQTAANVLALCGGAGFTLALLQVLKYSFRADTPYFVRNRATIVLLDQELLISLAMLIAALATAVSWDALFPDRRDCLVLSPLPVRTRDLLTAKLASILLVIFLLVVVSLACPSVVTPLLAGYSLFIQAIIVLAAAGFVFFTFLAFQALLLHLLPYRTYTAVSPVVQVVLLLGSIVMFLLVPDFTALQKQGVGRAWFLPPVWFLVLQQIWMGAPPPLPAALASLALWSFVLTAALALVLYAAGFRRVMRKAVEGSELSLSAPGALRRTTEAFLNATVLRDPKRRAVFWFTARSLVRNRKHRLLLSIYFAAGFAWVVEGLRHGITSSGMPSTAQLALPLDFALFLLIGLRVLFTLPVELNANWIFRLTEGGPASRYLAGARMFLWIAALVPVVLIPLPIYAAIWGWRTALIHTAFLILTALLLVERLLWRFPKIPFTCSYLPGKANLKVRLGAYFVLLAALSSFLSATEYAILRSETAWTKALPLLTLLLIAVVWRRRRLEGDFRGFQFEENAGWWMARLNLER